MPAKSIAQQRTVGAALAVKCGEASDSMLKRATRPLADCILEHDLEELASRLHRTLPEKKTPG